MPKIKISKPANKALKRLKEMQTSLDSTRVHVGLTRHANAYPDGTSVVMVAAVHEFGSEASGVPERSFLRSTLNANRRKYKKMFRKLAEHVARGRMSTNEALGTLGLQLQTDVKTTIDDIKDPPLLHRKGNPLWDTGHLIQSITFEVKD